MSRGESSGGLSRSDLLYDLPERLVAQFPPRERSGSRLLVADAGQGSIEDADFPDMVGFLRGGDLLVLNDTRVIRARLRGTRKETGGKIEVLLTEPADGPPGTWTCMIRPARRARRGTRIDFPGGFEGVVLENRGGGRAIIAITREGSPAERVDESIGEIPLPPYIRRRPGPEDEHRYQTVYASEPGAIAAPTAGLHFTPALLERIAAGGVEIAYLTLHVGPGTFRPLRHENLADNRLEEERYHIPAESREMITRALSEGRRVVSVGTTTMRVLESVTFDVSDPREPLSGRTDLFIHPPWTFRNVDLLVTNFHLPGTSLLSLVAAFIGVGFLRRVYDHAVREEYRFYSYGDAMLAIPHPNERRPGSWV